MAMTKTAHGPRPLCRALALAVVAACLLGGVWASSEQAGASSEKTGVSSSKSTAASSDQAAPEETARGVISSAMSTCRGQGDTFFCTAREVVGRLQRSGGVQLFDGVNVRWAERPANSSDHVLNVDFKRAARSLGALGSSSYDGARKWLGGLAPAAVAGKSSFLAGFGLGFLTFALKKLLLPFFIGAQIVKSVLIAMFLPSLLGGLGKIVGKGVSTIASSSGSSRPSGGGGAGGDGVDDFEFKDNLDSEAAMSETSFTYPEPAFSGVTYAGALPAGTLPASSLYGSRNPSSQAAASSKVSYVSGANTQHYGSYYTRYNSAPKHDYKVFHNIPSSSMLLTNYDPFYSPLLSRLDSVFKQLGYDSEPCRERLVCSMYSNPAKFAPYSNLVSAQLSRELNELRKPSSDNPEILRFFRYMKAAKDGQDGKDCFTLHPSCGGDAPTATGPPLVKTFHEINKLVQARKLSRR